MWTVIMRVDPGGACVLAGLVAALLLLGGHEGRAQPPSGVTGHAPPGSRVEPPPSGGGRSRLPLVDPSAVPPGGSGAPQQAPPGTPGAAAPAPGQSGETGNRR